MIHLLLIFNYYINVFEMALLFIILFCFYFLGEGAGVRHN